MLGILWQRRRFHNQTGHICPSWARQQTRLACKSRVSEHWNFVFKKMKIMIFELISGLWLKGKIKEKLSELIYSTQVQVLTKCQMMELTADTSPDTMDLMADTLWDAKSREIPIQTSSHKRMGRKWLVDHPNRGRTLSTHQVQVPLCAAAAPRATMSKLSLLGSLHGEPRETPSQ